MPKKTITPLFLLVLGLGTLAAETLSVQVENAELGKGHLMVGIFNEEAKFPDEYYQGQRVAVTDRTMVITFTGLPRGMYAVSVYQDGNDNEKLDRNIFGIPKEKYGFSNNSDRPDYKKCLFDFNADMAITVRMK